MRHPNASRRAALLLLLAPAAAAGRELPTAGAWWEITTEMQLKGMPFVLPPTVVKVCTGEGEEDRLPEEPGCTYTTLGRSGATVRWKMSCPSQGTEATGENTYKGDSWHGVSTFHSRDGDMTMKSRGRKVGPACNPREERAKAEAQAARGRREAEDHRAQAEVARREGDVRECRAAVERVRAADFTRKGGCADPAARADLCRRLQTREGYERAGDRSMNGEGNLGAAAGLCGVDLAALERRFCQEALRTDDLRWLRGHCAAEVKVVAKRECAGRDYTSTQERYRAFCAAVAADGLGPSATGEAGPRGAKAGAKERKGKEARPAAEATDPQDPPALEKGRALLKGLLGG